MNAGAVPMPAGPTPDARGPGHAIGPVPGPGPGPEQGPAAGPKHRLSYAECSARQRIAALFDASSFHEWLPPAARAMSPHLAALGVPAAFDDGVAVGRARLDGRCVFVAAQEGEFMGGGVGEVHGAKLVGLLRRALRDRPAAVVLLAESGGVRLHEANAGLIAVSEVMRALLDVRAAGVPVLVLIGGANGCFGGMGIVARCADQVVMSDIARLAMSGPEVIEASHGVEEFDSRDRALVWRTTGGKHRYLLGDCDQLVDDDVAAFRSAAIAALAGGRPITLQALRAEQALLAQRLAASADTDDAVTLWQRLGVPQADRVSDSSAAEVRALRRAMPPGPATWPATRPATPPAAAAPARPARPAAPGATEAPQAGTLSSDQALHWQALAEALFGTAHAIRAEGDFLSGTATFDGATVAVVGSTAHAPIGYALALRQAQVVLETMAQHPGRAILLLIDTQGQQLRRRDELLGINRAMAHLGCCIDLARRCGHRVIGLVYDQALSGGFITSGLIADACHALPEAEIRVMRIPAMARVTKLSEALLTELAQSNPVFAPGVQNYVRMGGVRSVWGSAPERDLAAGLRAALADGDTRDRRAEDGRERGGRLLAAEIAERVLAAD